MSQFRRYRDIVPVAIPTAAGTLMPAAILAPSDLHAQMIADYGAIKLPTTGGMRALSNALHTHVKQEIAVRGKRKGYLVIAYSVLDDPAAAEVLDILTEAYFETATEPSDELEVADEEG